MIRHPCGCPLDEPHDLSHPDCEQAAADEIGHELRHYCSSPACPGLPWRASDHRHPCPQGQEPPC